MIIGKNEIINRYIGLTRFLGAVLGKNFEIVLHDLTDLDNSIVAIENGHVSNRSVGGPATNLVVNILKNEKYSEKQYLLNYHGESTENKNIRSSTFFIRDDAKQIIGMLCINFDASYFQQARDAIDSLFRFDQERITEIPDDKNSIIEHFANTIDGTLEQVILKVLNRYDIPPERMSMEEKINLVSELNDEGIFLIKGAVSEVSKELKVSEATIYRYLNKIS